MNTYNILPVTKTNFYSTRKKRYSLDFTQFDSDLNKHVIISNNSPFKSYENNFRKTIGT